MRVVIPSVRYADFLAVTLPAWRETLPKARVIVVTSADDAETIAVTRAAGADLCVTDVWRKGAKFNVAAAKDRAFGFVPGYTKPPKPNEICVAIDADVYPFGRFPRTKYLDADTIYSCARYVCESHEALEAHKAGQTRREDCALIPPLTPGGAPIAVPHSPEAARRAARRCLGYCQIFRYHPSRLFGESQTAGGYDLRFRDQFPKRGVLKRLYVLHLGERNRRNWRGRIVAEWPAAS